MIEGLIKKLKDYTHCNDDVAISIRKAILEPFQLDLSQPDSIRKPPPTPADFKRMAVSLAPHAMSIVNQNIKSLTSIKKANLPRNIYTVATNCLVDTTFYSLTALRHMSSYTSLEPIDIEKSTSNLICKMVDLGEYDRSLDELAKLRIKLASYAKVSLNSSKNSLNTKNPVIIKSALTETSVNQSNSVQHLQIPIYKTQWENDMITKYQDLFQFPLDQSINKETIILLVLAYQMNTIRCWCELNEGSLAKFLPFVLDKPGNFFDWCLHLLKFNEPIARQQLCMLQRLLYSVANKFPLTEDSAYYSYTIQVMALKASRLSSSTSLKLIMDRMVRIGITYEKATKQTLYTHIQNSCNDFLESVQPNVKDLEEMDSYFVLCEYYAYISKKAKSYKGAFYAYKYMIKPLREILENSTLHTYYYTAYAANAKLALGSVQMDKMVLNDTFADISTTLTEVVALLKYVASTLNKITVQDKHSDEALFNLCKSIDTFKQSSKRLYDYIMSKAQEELSSNPHDPFKTPPRHEELITPSNYGQWNSVVSYLNSALLQCSETLPMSLCLIKRSITSSKRVAQPNDIMMSFVEIMVLLSRMEFKVNDEDSHQLAYEHLSTAEQICTEKKFTSGYRWLSGAYYNLGTALIKMEIYDLAIYPIRKSCTLLEKDVERASSEEGRVQLCKRYEILGVCSQKTKHFNDSIKSYRLALKRISTATVEEFVSKSETVAVSTLMEQETLIPKLMDRFLRASVNDPNQSSIQFACEFINLSALKPIQQCILFECELKIWNTLALKMDLSKFQQFIIDKLLQLYDAENYPIRRARVLLSQIQVERSKVKRSRETCLEAAVECAKQVIQLLKVNDYKEDISLLNYRVHYIASANSWIAICNRELKKPTPDNFTITLQQWGTMLKKLTPIYNSVGTSKQDIEHIYNSIDGVDQFYNHMRMLADLFAVTGEYVYQICALRILLKLNNGLRESQADCVSDSIILSSTIGRVYCDLGYTGKASVEFSQAQLAISNRSCSNVADLVYRIHYSYYLSCIGDYDTSKEVFDATKIVWKYTPMDDVKDSVTTVKAYTKRCMILSDAYFTLSKIQANTDTLDNAIINATSALQLLTKCNKVLQTAHQEKEANQTELENPFLASPPPEPKRVVFRESQWVIAHKMGQSLRYLAHLCMQKGSWNEAEYFVKQGPLLAEKVYSGAMFFESALYASEYYLRCGDLSKSQDHFEKATQWQPKGSHHYLENAKLKSSMAHLALENKYYEIATKTYDEANAILEKIAEPEYIQNLEKLIHDDRAQERQTKVTFEDEKGEPDCVPLQQIQSANIIQKAKAFAQQGNLQEALDMITSLEESDLAIEHIIELISVASKWRLSLIEKDLIKQRNQPNSTQQVHTLPAMKIQAGRGVLTSRPSANKSYRKEQENVSDILERVLEAYRIGFSKERTDVIRNLCTTLGASMFLNDQLSSSGMAHNDLKSSYYLSMANGIHMRREMQNCLKIKLNKILPGHAPSDSEWPASDEDSLQERYGRLAGINRNPKWLQSHLDTLSFQYSEENNLDDNEFKEKFVNILPNHWTVCSITVDPVNHDIYAVQLRSNEAPFVIKLPMNRTHHRPGGYPDTISLETAKAELKDIIEKSDETIHMSKDCIDASQVKSWWEKRINLDNRIKVLLDSMENEWFSGFKGIMSGRLYEHKEELVKFQKGLNDIVFKFIKQNTSAKKPVDFHLNFCRLAFKLGRHPTERNLEDFAYYTLACYENQDVTIDYTKITIKHLTDQIRILINRYHDKCGMAGVLSTKTIPNDHVILILDKHLQAFPIESMPGLRFQSVSRLPCLSFLRDRILYTQSYINRTAFEDFGVVSSKEWKDMTVSKKSAYYVLNPGGDLKDTQKEFESLFKSVPEWDGVMQTMPVEFQCKDALQKNDIYMYFGHSAGQAFIKGTTVRQLPSCAVSLLMGCSSGVLNNSGEFDPYGYVLNYLLAGSPAVVANLWDVTDKSIDKLTKHMMSSWGLLGKKSNTSKSLVQAVTESRNVCKLPYLIGAAPVVYGIPVYIENNCF